MRECLLFFLTFLAAVVFKCPFFWRLSCLGRRRGHKLLLGDGLLVFLDFAGAFLFDTFFWEIGG